MAGSLQKKKGSKNYYAVVYVQDKNGVKRQKWISTKTEIKREAKKVLNEIVYSIQQNEYINFSSVLFTEFMSNWLNDVICNQVEQTTLDGYNTNINTHIIPYFESKKIKLSDLKTWHLQKYFDYKLKNGRADGNGGLSANTLKKQYVNIVKALDYAVKMELIKSNPAKNVTMPKIKPYEAKYLTVDQAQILLEGVKGTIIEAAVILSTYYGFRRGEVLGLRWSDINFDEDYLTIQNTRTKVTKPVEKQPKTKSSIRRLCLIPSIKAYLKDLRIQQKKDKLLMGNKYVDNDYVCKYKDGNELNIVTLNHAFKRALKKYNLPDIRFHDLRHSTASFLNQLGYGAKEIQAWLGHSNISTTMDIYVHLFKETNTEIANGMSNLFNVSS